MLHRKIMALFLAALMLLSLVGTAGAEEADGGRRLTLYWRDDGADYDKCDVWVWFPGKDGGGHLFEPCDYGVKCVIDVPEGVSEVASSCGRTARTRAESPGVRPPRISTATALP